MRRNLLERVLHEIEDDLAQPHASEDPAFLVAANQARVGLIDFARYEGEAFDEAPRAMPVNIKSHLLLKKPKPRTNYDTIRANRSRRDWPAMRGWYYGSRKEM